MRIGFSDMGPTLVRAWNVEGEKTMSRESAIVLQTLKMVESQLQQYSDYSAFDLLLARASECDLRVQIRCKAVVAKHHNPAGNLGPLDWVRAAIVELDPTWKPPTRVT